jgi:hypothetical protein
MTAKWTFEAGRLQREPAGARPRNARARRDPGCRCHRRRCYVRPPNSNERPRTTNHAVPCLFRTPPCSRSASLATQSVRTTYEASFPCDTAPPRAACRRSPERAGEGVRREALFAFQQLSTSFAPGVTTVQGVHQCGSTCVQRVQTNCPLRGPLLL